MTVTKVVAFGGGHGLSASLRALRRCAPELDLDITAVVTVGDDGGSSGRLRAARGGLPPGDLRQALVALAGDHPATRRSAQLFQHRFARTGAGLAAADGTPVAGRSPARTPAATSPAATSPAATSPVATSPVATASAPAASVATATAAAARAATASAVGASAVGASAVGASARTDAGPPTGTPGATGTRPGGGCTDGLDGHALGNLVLFGLMELLGDPVAALEHAGTMLGAVGRVLPMSCEPVGIEAQVRGADPARPDEVDTVRGQHQVAVTTGRVEALRLTPSAPVACPQAVAAIGDADWLIFGPGSWYTSVLPHLLVPGLADAIVASPARRLVTLNLSAEKETLGLSAAGHLAALRRYLPELTADCVLADDRVVKDPESLARAAESLGARLVLAPIAVADGSPRHDPAALGAALVPVLGAAR